MRKVCMTALLTIFVCSIVLSQKPITITIGGSAGPIDAYNKHKKESKQYHELKIQLSASRKPTKAITIDLKIQPPQIISKPELITTSVEFLPEDYDKVPVDKIVKIKLEALECLIAGEQFIIKGKSSQKNVTVNGSLTVNINQIQNESNAKISLITEATYIKPYNKSESKKEDGLRTVIVSLLLEGPSPLNAPNISFSIPGYAKTATGTEVLNIISATIPVNEFNANSCAKVVKVPVVIKLKATTKNEEIRVPILLNNDDKNAHTIIISKEQPKEEEPQKTEKEKEPAKKEGFTHSCGTGNIFTVNITRKSPGGVITLKEATETKEHEYIYQNFFHINDFTNWLYNIYRKKIQESPYNSCITFLALRVKEEMSIEPEKKDTGKDKEKEEEKKTGEDTKDAKEAEKPKNEKKGETGDKKSDGDKNMKKTDAPDTVRFSQTYSFNDSLYTLSITKYDAGAVFKVCNNEADTLCNEVKISGKADSTIFFRVVKDMVKNTFATDEKNITSFTPSLKQQFLDFSNKVADYEKKKKDDEAKKKNDETDKKNKETIAAQRDTIAKYAAKLEEAEDRIAGEIFLNKKVNVFIKTDKSKSWTDRNTLLYGYLIVEKGSLQTENNKISSISVLADFYNLDGELIKKGCVIKNNNYSISFDGLNQRLFTNKIPTYNFENADQYRNVFFNYGDLIRYSPRGSDHSPIVTNQQHRLGPDSTTIIYRRRYSDYLSFRTFLDPLGFLGNNPNGFAQLEGDAILPANTRNYKRITWMPQIHANFSYIYSNTINSERRFAETYIYRNDSFQVFNQDSSRYISRHDSSYYMQNLDIVRKAYYQLYIRGAVCAFEFKKQNSFLMAELGFRVFGAKVASPVDSNKIYHKIVPEINFKWLLRPDNIFGADLNLGFSYFGNLHRANNSPTNINNPSFLWKSAFAVPHELNVYVYTGRESKGGLYFRYNGWYSISKKLADNIDQRFLPSVAEIKKTSYFPQILVGYSTNLSTMIKGKN